MPTPGTPDDPQAENWCVGWGTADGNHCCWVDGDVCQYLIDNGSNKRMRRFECSLRKELGSWTAVHADPRYQEDVQSHWDSLGTREDGTPVIKSCGSWQPGPGECCREGR